jgi:RNA polymerase sigma-70 factor (ECF subfamily)
MTAWSKDGIPDRAGAWLTTVARRRAIDVVRRQSTQERLLPLLVGSEVVSTPYEGSGAEVPDDRLRLIFTCCHPALSSEVQVALTLRLLCGLSTSEVARAFSADERKTPG